MVIFIKICENLEIKCVIIWLLRLVVKFVLRLYYMVLKNKIEKFNCIFWYKEEKRFEKVGESCL